MMNFSAATTTNRWSILTSNAIYDELSGGNYIYANVNTNGWTPAATDLVSTNAAGRPVHDGFGQASQTSPDIWFSAQYSTNGFPATFTPAYDTISTLADASTSSTVVVMTTLAAADAYNNNEALFVSGNNVGQYRRIVDTVPIDANTNATNESTKLILELPLTAAWAVGDKITILPRMTPTSGDMSVLKTGSFGFNPQQWPSLADLYGRTSNVNYNLDRLSSGFPTLGVASPGCVGDVFQSFDYRWGGELPPPQPGKLDAPAAVNPPPPTGGGFGLRPGIIHAYGND